MKKTRHTLSCVISSCLDELHCADAMTEKLSRKLSLDNDRRNNLAIAVTEAVGNAIMHGNRQDPHKKVHIEFAWDPDKIEVCIRDEGKGFDPETLEDPLLPENLMRESGRGVFILNQLMDEVRFEFSPRGTTLHMVMKLA
ncbi:ATP-binding protein [bacterium]|nr:ATP-binding protein [bacterium]